MIESWLTQAAFDVSPAGGIDELRSRHAQQESFELFGDGEKKKHFFSDIWHSRKAERNSWDFRGIYVERFYKGCRLC